MAVVSVDDTRRPLRKRGTGWADDDPIFGRPANPQVYPVGTALNAINQGPEMLSGHWPVLWKLALTYAVPFLVASYGSYAAFRSSD